MEVIVLDVCEGLEALGVSTVLDGITWAQVTQIAPCVFDLRSRPGTPVGLESPCHGEPLIASEV
eukprot:1628207-Amphidinium_carterae.1